MSSVELSPSQRVMLNDAPAEVIRTRTVGDIEYLRAFIEGEGVKIVCLDDVDVRPHKTRL
ncbi:hypothetical protein [Haladaptatus sp. DYF46]|uniref:hypothetical protein n=1 Tax=Haladaptatus sp. DYF46 TaxID=2886041 RepID=UPI001E39F9F2|nr:hypothetical protein [Haladaptatus sp. DYF46]